MKKRKRKRNPDLSYEAGDLILFADNTESLYKARQRAVRRIVKALNSGTYSTAHGRRQWKGWLTDAAHQYRQELGTRIPAKAITEAVAEYERDTLKEIHSGEWEWVEELIKRRPNPKRNITKWMNVHAKMEWRSGTDGYGEIQIVRAERVRPFRYLLMTRPYTGQGTVLSDHGSLAAAKKAGEVYARRLHSRGIQSNPRRKTVTRKKRRTPAQQRATAKMLAANRSRRGKKTTRRRNPARGNFLVARAALRTPRTPVRNPVRKLGTMNHYGIKAGAKWFDGKGWTASKANAAMWRTLTTAKSVAQKVSDHTNKSVTIHSM